MCSVSVVHDYFRQNTQIKQWDQESFDQYREVLRLLKKLDDKLDQKDCEDPSKAAWMKEVEARLKKLEKSK